MLSWLQHHTFAISQVFGLAALVLNVIRFTRTSRKSVLLWGPPVSLSSVVSQLADRQVQGAAMSCVSMVTATLQAHLPLPQQRWWRRALFALAVAVGVAIAPPSTEWVTAIPLVFFFISRWGEALHSELRMRSVWLLGSVLRIVYFALYSNYMLVASETLVFVLSLRRVLGLLRQRVQAPAHPA